MKTKAFIKEKLYMLLLACLTSMISAIFLGAVRVNQEVIYIIQLLLWGMVLSFILIDYLRRVGFYRRMEMTLEQLDQKYLLTEILEEPLFLDGQIFYETLQTINKSMADHVNSYKVIQKEYKDYVEMWVHEIKTPLAASKLIISNHPSDVTKSIQEEIEKVENFVDQALFYARSTSVEKDYVIKELELDTILSKVIRKHAKEFIYRKIKISLHDVNCGVYSDGKWLEFIIDQILSNALKYTKDDEGEIELSATKEDNITYLHIKDNGIGIANKDVKRIFDRGFTGTNGRSNEKATGMGLYLCKTLCDKLYVSIQATSKPEQGTCITIGFPAHALLQQHIVNE